MCPYSLCVYVFILQCEFIFPLVSYSLPVMSLSLSRAPLCSLFPLPVCISVYSLFYLVSVHVMWCLPLPCLVTIIRVSCAFASSLSFCVFMSVSPSVLCRIVNVTLTFSVPSCPPSSGEVPVPSPSLCFLV